MLEARSQLDSTEIARKVVEVASDRQATDVVLLDLRRQWDFADYFVVATGESEPQRRALTEEIAKTLHNVGVSLHHREGSEAGGWVLLDFGDVIVHIFDPEARGFYQLDRLWDAASRVVYIQ